MEGMATGGPAASTIDGDSITSSSSRARNNPSAPVKHQQLSSAPPEAHGFRPSPGIVAVQSQGHHHPSSIPSYQSTSLQHLHLQESPSGGQSVAGHFSVSNPPHLSSSHQQQRPHHQHVTNSTVGNPRHQQQHQHQHQHHPAQVVIPSSGLSSKLSRSSQLQVSRQSSPHDERVLENRSHPVVTRPVANMGQLQGVAAAIAGGSHLGKQQNQNQNHLVLQRPQQVGTTTQDKVIGGVAAQKQQQNSAQKQQGGMQRVHPRSSNPGGGWQPPVVALGGQHGHVSPAGQSRLFYQHPVLNSQQPRSSPQEQGQGQVRQHLGLVGVPPQQYAMPQQQMRDGGVPTGSKSVPMYPVLRTPVTGNHTPNHVDTGYRERLSDSQIIVHIGDRKIRLLSESDPSSLYSLCRRWVRNDVPRKDRPGLRDIMNIPLPRPLSVSEVDKLENATLENDTKGDAGWSKSELEKPVDLLTEEELLQSHIQQFKTIRKRSREERMRRIARFKPRLALLLPGNNESN